MAASESTCWTVIRAGSAGSPADRDELGRRYLGVVQAYLSARWRASTLRKNLDDATQEVFINCFDKVACSKRQAPGAFRTSAVNSVNLDC
jgi:hypothetical protein